MMSSVLCNVRPCSSAQDLFSSINAVSLLQGAKANMEYADMQNECWSEGDELGRGGNCSVHACTSAYMSGVVVKKGPLAVLAEEAEKMWRVPHPNVVRLHGIVDSDEADEHGIPIGYLAIEELDVNVAEVMDFRR